MCGAVLLSKLLKKIIQGLEFSNVPIYAWTDSTVVLYWLKAHASKWKPFVAYRVAEIQSMFLMNIWNYVSTTSNPADAATRGISEYNRIN